VSRAALAAVLAVSTACTHRVPAFDPDAPLRIDDGIAFDNHLLLELHMSRPCAIDQAHPLIVFATGDGGWRGNDRTAFERMARWGYPMVGFSSPAYLRYVAIPVRETTPGDVARDFARIITIAKTRMELDESTPTILVGVSRGAGLTVAAAGEPGLQLSLAGVVAVALTREEEYVHRLKRKRKTPDKPPEMVMIDNYEYLPRLRSLPLSIIQSVHDGYLPAEEARRLLGPDSELRQLHPIAAKNHNFSDAREPLYLELQTALEWVSHFGAEP
jgi:pimeloyl-ACP methyl ester carboxylesterase